MEVGMDGLGGRSLSSPLNSLAATALIQATIHPTSMLEPLLFTFRAPSPFKKALSCYTPPEVFLTLLRAIVPSLNMCAHQLILIYIGPYAFQNNSSFDQWL